MDNGRKEYTFLWFIENYSYCWHENGEGPFSPYFYVDGLGDIAWNLQLYPRGKKDDDKGFISLYLNRSLSDEGPANVSLMYELTALAADGSTFSSARKDYALRKGRGFGSPKFLKFDEIFMRKKPADLPQDILTVRCKIWNGEGSIHEIGQSSARTRIKVEKISFLHAVESFSTLQPNVKQTIKIRSNSREQSFISSSLYFTEGLCCEEKIIIEIIPTDANKILCKCELYLLDASGKEIECGKVDNRYDDTRKSIHALPLSFTRKVVLNKKSEYLPDDKLSLLCECTFSDGLEFNAIVETQYGICRKAVQQASSQVSSKNDDNTVEKLSTYPSVSEDIKALYIDEFLTDVELKTETKLFPAHKIVLCARSAVFKAMMTNEMKEKLNSSIRVDDLADDIVQRLLLFFYSDTVENLEWKIATELYYAADKYQVGKLKEVCSSFLLVNLSTSNAGELLLLADTHNDGDLKRSVEDFILEHEEQVFGSDEWERLMETNPLLVMKAMHLKYKRKKESK